MVYTANSQCLSLHSPPSIPGPEQQQGRTLVQQGLGFSLSWALPLLSYSPPTQHHVPVGSTYMQQSLQVLQMLCQIQFPWHSLRCARDGRHSIALAVMASAEVCWWCHPYTRCHPCAVRTPIVMPLAFMSKVHARHDTGAGYVGSPKSI